MYSFQQLRLVAELWQKAVKLTTNNTTHNTHTNKLHSLRIVLVGFLPDGHGRNQFLPTTIIKVRNAGWCACLASRVSNGDKLFNQSNCISLLLDVEWFTDDYLDGHYKNVGCEWKTATIMGLEPSRTYCTLIEVSWQDTFNFLPVIALLVLKYLLTFSRS